MRVALHNEAGVSLRIITWTFYDSALVLFALTENGGGRVLDAGIPDTQTAISVAQCSEMRHWRTVLRHQAGPPLRDPDVPAADLPGCTISVTSAVDRCLAESVTVS